MLLEREIIEKLSQTLSKDRFEHSIRVKDMAIKLAGIYNCDIEKVKVAALLHDCAKCYDCYESIDLCNKYNIKLDDITLKRHQLIHAVLGAKVAEIEYGVYDTGILSAIQYHTTGKANMTLLEKIIWLADYIEPDRNFKNIEKIRELAFKDINQAILLAMDNSIEFVTSGNKKIHPLTLYAKESILKEIN